MQSYFKWKTKTKQNSSSGNRMDTNPVAGDEHIDEKIFWPALKRLYKEKHRTMHTDNKEIVSLKLNKSDFWCVKKKYSPADWMRRGQRASFKNSCKSKKMIYNFVHKNNFNRNHA